MLKEKYEELGIKFNIIDDRDTAATNMEDSDDEYSLVSRESFIKLEDELKDYKELVLLLNFKLRDLESKNKEAWEIIDGLRKNRDASVSYISNQKSEIETLEKIIDKLTEELEKKNTTGRKK